MRGVREALGARPDSGTIPVTVFIPSVDRAGRRVPQAEWRERALATLGRLFRGATAFPPGRGVWRDDARGGALAFETVVLVTSYAARRAVTGAALRELRRFLHAMGRETRQGEVGVIVGNTYHGIEHFDAAARR